MIEENEKETSVVQRRCLRFTDNFYKGHILQEGDLFPLRPANSDGILPYEIINLLEIGDIIELVENNNL